MPTAESTSNPAIDLSAPADVLPRWLEAMRQGEFERAWRQTDRIELPRRLAERVGGFQAEAHHLVWNGEDFTDRTVLVRCDHGLGDTLQFVRYLRRLRRRAGRVILKAQPALLDLLADVAGADLVINGWTDAQDPPHDVEIECMEFSYAFRDTLASIPMESPYLPVQEISERSPIRISSGRCIQVGIIWAASGWDDSRSIPLQALRPLGEIPDVTFYSLQQGQQQIALTSAPFPIVSLSEQTTNIADAAAAMLQLDLIVSVDSMTAHLAGALGRPVWVLLKHEADWRWMVGRTDCPWYPSMRLFRQPRADDWARVVEQVAAALQESRHLASV